VPEPAADFPAAYRRFLAPVRMKCRRLLRDVEDAEEATHDTFARLLQAGPAWTSDADTPTVMAWLYRTCTRLCIDLLRRHKFVARPAAPRDDYADEDGPGRVPLPCAAHPEDSLAARRLVARISAEIPPAVLEAVVLCRVDGLPQTEAAHVLGVSERTLRRLLERFDAGTETMRKEFAS
jgi:RNA polymerase sigma-70 factor, ECF subfamily